ncbi:AraC family transcriptional regulator [Fulvimarina sp. 2208YS6-2-32]|uniref:AraC family transcriptional regulator n=1 Tax=Fulvimarina uroteuthidis TaxID=3098149 RepID=A0ABU5I610_9HYPH|nr:AraC family transcriptional regulator [Fulvimarina sp. 2208YS6-2-32]MDY8110819.1 AraC family transcriptional regulator [Fulvimarina sp. 2208YS6-2-32]
MSNALRLARGPFGRVALLDMDRPLVRHAHPHCHILLKVEGADTQFAVGNRIVPLTDESAVLINAWEPHSYSHHQNQPATIILALYIEPRWLGEFRPNWKASGAPDFFTRSVDATSPAIRRLTRQLAEAMVHQPGGADEHERLLADLMIAVIERFADWRGVPSSLRAAASAIIDPRIRKAVLWMQADPGAVSDMNSIAVASGLSRAQFFRLFEASLGVSPRVYLNVLRLERAVIAVSDGTASFTSVSQTLGFSVPAHFSRFFHDHAGSPPSTFRNVARLQSVDFETLR